jgi:hypothetical protein
VLCLSASNKPPRHNRPQFGHLIPALSTALSMPLIVAQCNFTTQSYNMGKLLNPGESMATLAVGGQPWYSVRDSSVAIYSDTGRDATYLGQNFSKIRKYSGQEFSYCFDYRLGILDKYPLGKGLEFGFHFEAPAPSESGGGGLLLDIDLRSGLPPSVIQNAVFHHNIGLGWTVGLWVDNGVYAEYAAGLEYKYFIPYTNLRLLCTATDISGNMGGVWPNFFNNHAQFWNIRQCLGCAIKIPRLPVLPDYVVPEVTLGYPNYNRSQHVGFTYHIGLRWLNGF